MTEKPSGSTTKGFAGMAAVIAGTMIVAAVLAIGYLWMGAPAPPS